MSVLPFLAGVAPAAAVAPVTRIVMRASPATVHVGAVVTVSGTVTPQVTGIPVVLQRLVAGKWVGLRSTPVSAAGRFSFSVRSAAPAAIWQVRVARIGSKGVPAGVSATRAVRVTAAIFAVRAAPAAARVAAGQPIVVTGSVTPRAGGTVRLQRLQGRSWRDFSSTQLVAGSTYRFSSVQSAGTYRLRVVRPFTPTIADGVSRTVTVTVAAAPTPAPSAGVVLVKPTSLSRDGDASLVQVGSGAASMLPRSKLSTLGSSDAWSASGGSSTGDLVRVDAGQNIEFFARSTSARTGGFSVNALPGVNQPQLWSPVKPSPDGRFVLAYWKRDYRQDKPALTVFDRNGNIIESGSKYDYDASAQSSAFDWLPDGRYIYLAGTRIVLTTIGSPNLLVATLTLPANTGAEGTLAVSPDGRRLLMTLPVVMPDPGGIDVSYGLLFTAHLDGSSLTQLTTLSTRAAQAGIRLLHRRASWSPDGTKVMFAIDTGISYSIPAGGNGCPPVMVVPSAGYHIAVDGIYDADSYHVLVSTPQPGSTLKACYGPVFWLASP